MHLELFYKVIICHHLTIHKLHTYEKNFSNTQKGYFLSTQKMDISNLFSKYCRKYSGYTAPKIGKAYVVSNAHLDTQWLWTVRTSIIDYIPRIHYQNLALIHDYPDYIFNFEGAVKYNWMKEYYPLDYEKVKEAIKNGRWHVSGSSWDANDVNVPSPESSFRNILLGQEFYKKEFGLKSTDIFYPTVLVSVTQLPSIAKHCGLIGFSTQKLGWRKKPFYGDSKIPFTIGRWKGIDGAELICALDCGSYVHNFKDDDLTKDNDLIQSVERDPMRTAYRYFGAGDRGGSAMPVSAMAIEKAQSFRRRTDRNCLRIFRPTIQGLFTFRKSKRVTGIRRRIANGRTCFGMLHLPIGNETIQSQKRTISRCRRTGIRNGRMARRSTLPKQNLDRKLATFHLASIS